MKRIDNIKFNSCMQEKKDLIPVDLLEKLEKTCMEIIIDINIYRVMNGIQNPKNEEKQDVR